jgi:hypothetical protein
MNPNIFRVNENDWEEVNGRKTFNKETLETRGNKA